MAEARISLRVAGLGRLKKIIDDDIALSRDPMRAMGPEMIASRRRFIREEFAGGFYYNPSGGRTRWKRTRAFGTRPAPAVPLGGARGGPARAWDGGENGGDRITARTWTIFNSRPDSAVHRGGNRSRPRVGQLTNIKPKRFTARGDSAMRMTLGLGDGVWISDDRLRAGVDVPARPHAGPHPRANEEDVRIAGQFFEKR